MADNLEAKTGEGNNERSEEDRKYTLLAYNQAGRQEIFGLGDPAFEACTLVFDSVEKAEEHLNGNLRYVMHNGIIRAEIVPFGYSSTKFGEPVKRFVLKWVEG